MRRKWLVNFSQTWQLSLLFPLQIGFFTSHGVLSSPIVSKPTEPVIKSISTTKTTEISLFPGTPTTPQGYRGSKSGAFTTILTASKHKQSPATSKTPPAAVETSPWSNKRVEVEPSFFFQEGWKIKCVSESMAFNIIWNYIHGILIPPLTAWNLQPSDWQTIMRPYRRDFREDDSLDRQEEHKFEIGVQQNFCTGCVCTADGRLRTSPPSNYLCSARNKPVRCAVLFATLGQPGVLEGATIEDMQAGIDRIPNSVRGDPANQGWSWQVDPRIAQYIGHRLTYANLDPLAAYVGQRVDLELPTRPLNGQPDNIGPEQGFVPPGPYDFLPDQLAPAPLGPYDFFDPGQLAPVAPGAFAPGPLGFGVNVAPPEEPPNILYGPQQPGDFNMYNGLDYRNFHNNYGSGSGGGQGFGHQRRAKRETTTKGEETDGGDLEGNSSQSALNKAV
ncbi:hypothetical protein TWF718_000616 [Orbilia javanica]|uniref:Uncharacterized protein n=1 Tax=Orbilia javanica TaxID=47235 RepID=A0AAN8NCJ3_9PEZI